MNKFKKEKVIILPTEDRSNIFKYEDGILQYQPRLKYAFLPTKAQHLYIISNEDIKEGEKPCWCYNSIKNSWDKDLVYYQGAMPHYHFKGFKKIIASTNIDLFKLENCPVRGGTSSVKYVLPQPDQQFIEKYVAAYNKEECIAEVFVEYETSYLKWKNSETERLEDNTELKVNFTNNTITVNEVKNSWNIEAITALFLEFGVQATSKQIKLGHIPSEFVADELEIKKWLKDNIPHIEK